MPLKGERPIDLTRAAFGLERLPPPRMAAMSRSARVLTWNGRDVPAELSDLPADRYDVEPVDDEAPALSPDEEAGIDAALGR